MGKEHKDEKTLSANVAAAGASQHAVQHDDVQPDFNTLDEELDQLVEEVRQIGVIINYNERMETIEADGDCFIVKTVKGSYKTRSVLLSIGRRGTPRTLGVPGEEMTKVVYRLIDPEQYRGMHVLVVGGGDSALEAATSIADEPDTTVTISYRSDSFSRAKEKNREKVLQYEDTGKVKLLMSSTVQTIFSDSVQLTAHGGENHKIKNDAIIVSAGGILPTPFLKDIGIHVETKHGTA